jgi:hypothetical protein
VRRYILFVFLAVAAAVQAQDCSTAEQTPHTWNQQPPDPLYIICGTGVAQHRPFDVYSTTVDTCTSNNTGEIYDQGVRQVTAVGYWQCQTPSSMPRKCNPYISQQVTHALTGLDYNRFYLRYWDADINQYCGLVPVMTNQDFWQCRGIACPVCPQCPRQRVCTSGCSSPIVIDVSGKRFFLTDYQHGVKFDIMGNGHPEQIS